MFNPAAYTEVGKAESEPDQAFALNREGARAVAIANQDASVIHLSNDYVFDKRGAYVESDPGSQNSRRPLFFGYL
jgi:dTDP-4-dehydrorhamnose reductase